MDADRLKTLSADYTDCADLPINLFLICVNLRNLRARGLNELTAVGYDRQTVRCVSNTLPQLRLMAGYLELNTSALP
jgi:hypothetical protein